MQYHALSLAQAGYAVDVVAMPGSAPIAALRSHAAVAIHAIPPLPAWAARLPSLLGLAAKAAWQLGVLLVMMLVLLPAPAAILMQNPPAIPSMAVCWLAAARHRAAWLIDWHNTAFSILALKHGRHGWLIALSRAIEQRLGQRAAGHFCVTQAFKAWLEGEFGLADVTVLYDRPPAMFHRCSLPEAHRLLARLQPTLAADGIGDCLQQHLAAAAANGDDAMLLTCLPGAGSSSGQQQQPAWRPGRPALVVSSTSWTPDEDFGLLLAAAEAYDAAAVAADTAAARSTRSSSSSSSSSRAVCPDVLFVITGRGPQREMYLQRLRQLRLSHVAFASLWLEPEDYPLMLGVADLGVCLHTSSSGV
jgi:beta-1,4-mannosyltransferase